MIKRLKVISSSKAINLLNPVIRTMDADANPTELIIGISGDGWNHTTEEAISNIKQGTYTYFVKARGLSDIDIIISSYGDKEYLKGTIDDIRPDSLLRLPRLLSQEELQTQAIEQFHFLAYSCHYFDSGALLEAKRLATTMRILLHDTGKSKSILGLVGKKTDFFSTSNEATMNEVRPENKVFSSELYLVSKIHNNQRHQYKPNFGKGVDFVRIDFESWWRQVVLVDIEGNQFSRERIILCVADQDGGAHVDPTLEEDYYKLTRLNTVGHAFANVDTTNGLPDQFSAHDVVPIPSPLPMYYTLRQIAHEILISRINPEGEFWGEKLPNGLSYYYDESLYNGMATGSIFLY